LRGADFVKGGGARRKDIHVGEGFRVVARGGFTKNDRPLAVGQAAFALQAVNFSFHDFGLDSEIESAAINADEIHQATVGFVGPDIRLTGSKITALIAMRRNRVIAGIDGRARRRESKSISRPTGVAGRSGNTRRDTGHVAGSSEASAAIGKTDQVIAARNEGSICVRASGAAVLRVIAYDGVSHPKSITQVNEATAVGRAEASVTLTTTSAAGAPIGGVIVNRASEQGDTTRVSHRTPGTLTAISASGSIVAVAPKGAVPVEGAICQVRRTGIVEGGTLRGAAGPTG
jgi:hypothetical protein